MNELAHGTLGRYRKGCRCEPCRAEKKANKDAYLERQRDRDDRGLPRNPPGRPRIPLSQREHGVYVTYCKGCRCDPCAQAWRTYNSDRYVSTRKPEDESVTRLRQAAAELGYSIRKTKQKD